MQKYADKVFAQTRMPFVSRSELQPNQVFIGETEFTNPDDDTDSVKLTIYLAAPKFTAKMEEFAKHGPTFVSDMKNYVLQHERKVLADLVEKNGGKLHLVLNKVPVVLEHKVHFWLDARDRLTQ